MCYTTAAMKTKKSTITIGLDLGDRKHAVCVLDAKGGIIKQETITNTHASLTALSRRHPAALVVMEVGMHSPWTSRFLEGLGHRVLVANPRKVRAIYQNILGPYSPDTALKRKGLKIAERGGPRAKRKAVVAVARNLAVLMLTLWHDEELYEANRSAA
jgi:hypothetical protein